MSPLEISERKKKILAAVVNSYITTAEPVGSKAIAKAANLDLSSATIRNEMAELETLGYLEQPHTSAGRIPTPLGYRIYVNELMERHKVSLEDAEAINQSLSSRIRQLDHLISDVGKLTANLTSYPAYAVAAPAPATVSRFDLIFVDPNTFIIVAMLSNSAVRNKLVRLPFSVEQSTIQKLSTFFNASFTNLPEHQITALTISSAERALSDTVGLVSVLAGFTIEILSECRSGEAFVAGTSHLLRQPEYKDPDKAHRVMSYLSDSSKLLELPPLRRGAMDVIIGPENVAEELKDSSVIIASYNAGDNMKGLIGVVGPTRMDYAALSAKLGYIAETLSRALGGGNPPGRSYDDGDDTT